MSRPGLSFEFFPPQSLEASFRLWDTVNALAHLEPDFVSVTYGAGGTTRALTHEAVAALHSHMGLDVAAHLTCVNATREETLDIARQYHAAGVRRIVALRGDAPKGEAQFTPHPDGFRDAADLVAGLAETGLFELTVGAYPDPHPEARYDGADIDWLKRKVDAGATRAITQFFFEAETFFRFRDACAKAGIAAEIVPGVLPIESWRGVERFAQRCGARIPAELSAMFETALRDGREELLATAVCTELCSELLAGGASHLHFYTLNKPGLTRDVVHALGMAPAAALEKVA